MKILSAKSLRPQPPVILGSTVQEKLQSLAAELTKLKCKVVVRTHPELTSVTVTKYPLKWCLETLGWSYVSGTRTKTVYANNGHFQLEVYWRGTNYINPVGSDWN